MCGSLGTEQDPGIDVPTMAEHWSLLSLHVLSLSANLKHHLYAATPGQRLHHQHHTAHRSTHLVLLSSPAMP